MIFHTSQLPITAIACIVIATMNALPLRAEPPTPAGIDFFEKNIRPLLAQHCYRCHSEREEKREGGLLLDSRAGWSVGGDSGAAIAAGNLEASLLIRAVRYTDPDLQMPPEKSLSKEQIALLERWVAMGAPDPRDEATVEKIRRGNPSDPIAGREHWAFRPLIEESKQPPVVTAADWPGSPIDAFVIAKLEENNLQPADNADRRPLLRRVYFQLIGLPPTPEQATAFLNDNEPDAYERLVDQLLNSPQFGQRWGRHWLDLARYADSNGLDENFLFREAWRYRNWVIEAVNADMPYDRFLTEQIAGDLLPHDSVEQRDRQRIASGFLEVGPKVLLGNDPNQRRMDVADEQLDTIGKTVLGQTLGCARCHDHKFDPVPTADYYALAGILTSTSVMEQRYMLGEQRVMEQLIGLGTDGDQLDDAYEKYWRERPKLQKQQQRAKSALEFLEKGDLASFETLLAAQTEAISEGAKDAAVAAAQRITAQKAFVITLDAAIAKPPEIPPRAMISHDVASPADEAIRLAGQFNRLGDKVPRGFLRVFSDVPAEIPNGQSGRLQLAQWLTDTDNGAGRLAARVLANRIWYHMLGRGIVRTVDNFGRTGDMPTHPELLDHLASELIASQWSMKSLIRKIALSRAFMMSSRHNETAHGLDPDNKWLWRAHRRRLEPEALRDAMLSAAGTLHLNSIDSTVSYLGDQATAVGGNENRRRTDFQCRSVYLPVIRNDLPDLLAAFDFADPHATTGLRPQTMVATQGLFMLNDASVMDAADATARRVLTDSSSADLDAADKVDAADKDDARLNRLFELLLTSQPTNEERQDLHAFITSTQQRFKDRGEPDADLRTWTLVCQALFASSRFQLLE